MIQKIKKIKIEVERLLTKYPHLQDSDSKLIATIWRKEMGKDDKGVSKSLSTTANCFFEALAAGKHTPADVITRARRKVQEKNVFLRGQFYKERKKKQEEVRQEITKI